MLISTYRSDLVKIAEGQHFPMTFEMEKFVDQLIQDGQYTKATPEEIELFDTLFDEMEARA